MIYIGNQTSCWAATPREPFDYAAAKGFDAFDWFPDKKPDAGWDESDLDESQRRSIRAAALEHGIRLSVHARWQANPLQPESYPVFLADLEMAQALGAVLLNIHLCHEAGLAAYVEAITPLVRSAAQAGLQLSIENTPEHAPELFNDLFARLRALDSVCTQHVGMCLDLGHANLCAATRNDYLAFLDRLDPQLPISHLHLHENWGEADSHLPLFTGPAGGDDSGIRGLLERLRQRHFAGSLILEQWPQPPTLLDQARDRLRRLLNLDGGQVRPSVMAGQFTRRITMTTQEKKESRAGKSARREPVSDRWPGA
ncbi:MAG: sugar phosphate isomerase/epimerase family protein [Verrucomicrobiota bacterium]|jgi:sugar phosphate isomerase/epimerase